MGKYNSAIITTEGINMFASAIGGGDTVTFMTMQASSHAYPSTTDFMSLTSLQDVEATVNVNYAGVYSNNIVQVSARFDNDGVSTAYLINTLGLFAKLGNGEPKLVAVVTAQTPDQMPVYDANNPSAFIYNLQCTVQNAGSMAVSVNPAGTVTVEQFNEEMATKLGRTDNAVSATKLQTSRSLTVDLGSTTAASFDGSADASIGITGELPIANGGTGANTQAGARSALGVPPTNHAVANTTYGSGTSTNYGHVKLSDTYDTVDANADAAHGVGASQNAVANAYRNLQPKIDSLESRVSSSEQALTVNLLNPTLASGTVSGITFVRNADNSYTLNGTATKDTYLIVVREFTTTKSQKVRITGCPQGGTESTFNAAVQMSNGTSTVRDLGYGATRQLSAGESYNFLIVVKSGAVCDNLLFKPMLTTNLSATYDDYVPYSGSSGKLDTDYKTLHDAIDTKAPTNHAVANTTYGSGTATNYGHVKLSDTYDTVDANAKAANGVGASAFAMQTGLATKIGTFENQINNKISSIIHNTNLDEVSAYDPTLNMWFPIWQQVKNQDVSLTPMVQNLAIDSYTLFSWGKLHILSIGFHFTQQTTVSNGITMIRMSSDQPISPVSASYALASNNANQRSQLAFFGGGSTIETWDILQSSATATWSVQFTYFTAY